MQGLDQFIHLPELSDMLRAFHACAGLAVQLIDADGRQLLLMGNPSGYCKRLSEKVRTPGACQREHMDAGRRAQQLGEAYIFSCQASLSHIAFPLADRGVLLGTILVGPFLMDAPDSTFLLDLPSQRALDSSTLLSLYDDLLAVPIVPPEKVREISRLLFYLMAPVIPQQRRSLSEAREKLYQQARIGETIQMFKEQSPPPAGAYPVEQERELLTKVKTGDVRAAKGVLNDLLGYVFFCEGGRMDTMKNRSLELCTLLSRTAIEAGAASAGVFRLSNQYLAALSAIDTLDALCHLLQEVVEAFMNAAFTVSGGPGHEAVRRAASIIAREYATPLTLDTVARRVGLTPAYLSHIFKMHTGVSFREYLSHVRVEESKRLLAATDYSLVDIAIAMGFSDQSYFTKVFKKYTGLTPKQYR